MLTFNCLGNSKTHMPFLMATPEGQTLLLFCMSPYGIWKIHYALDGGATKHIETGFDVETECAPTCWCDESGFHLTFIAGGNPRDPSFKLYRMDGPTIDQLSVPTPICNTFTGFLYRDRLATVGPKGYGDKAATIYIRGRTDCTLEISDAIVYRISYRADNPDILIISGCFDGDNTPFAILYNLTSDEQFTVVCDGKPAYKCSILGDTVIYAERIGQNFEDRQLKLAEIVQLVPTTIASKRT